MRNNFRFPNHGIFFMYFHEAFQIELKRSNTKYSLCKLVLLDASYFIIHTKNFGLEFYCFSSEMKEKWKRKQKSLLGLYCLHTDTAL